MRIGRCRSTAEASAEAARRAAAAAAKVLPEGRGRRCCQGPENESTRTEHRGAWRASREQYESQVRMGVSYGRAWRPGARDLLKIEKSEGFVRVASDFVKASSAN